MSAGIRSFTTLSQDHEAEVKCTEDHSGFVGRLSMPLVSHLLSEHSTECNWYLGSHAGKLVCCFCDDVFHRELLVDDFPEGREMQVSKKVKKDLQKAVQTLTSSDKAINASIDACKTSTFCSQVINCLGNCIADSQRTRPEPQETSLEEKNSQPADKARTARNLTGGRNSQPCGQGKDRKKGRGSRGKDPKRHRPTSGHDRSHFT